MELRVGWILSSKGRKNLGEEKFMKIDLKFMNIKKEGLNIFFVYDLTIN